MKDRDFSEREAEENEIVNRHMAELMQELHAKNFNPEAALTFVVFGGRTERTTDYNLATIIDAKSVPTLLPERAREILLEYVHDEICEMLDDGDPDGDGELHEPPPGDAN